MTTMTRTMTITNHNSNRQQPTTACGTGGGQVGKCRVASSLNATARVLVLGDKQVGKSAAIVRFTTGRFIQNYCSSTNDWLYRHPMSLLDPCHRQRTIVQTVEILEQQLEAKMDESNENNECNPSEQLADSLHWADAFVVVYSLTSFKSFKEAAKCLDRLEEEEVKKCNRNRLSASNVFSIPMSNNQNNNERATARVEQASISHRPVLLLASKRDLGDLNGRQVSFEEGLQLSRRHQSLFAEVSVASESAKSIQDILMRLIERVDPCALHLSSEPASRATQLVRWAPPQASSIMQQAIQLESQTQQHGYFEEHEVLLPPAQLDQSASSIAFPVAPLLSNSLDEMTQMQNLEPLRTAQPTHRASLTSTSDSMSNGEKSSGTAVSTTSSTASKRYGTLKNSFKKASLAIVGGKMLAAKAKASRMAQESANLKRNSTTPSDLNEMQAKNSAGLACRTSCPDASADSMSALAASESQAALSKQNKSSSWIKSKFSLSSRQDNTLAPGSQSDPKLDGSEQSLEQHQGRFKRPLLKYKNRLKTVAFERNFNTASESNSCDLVPPSESEPRLQPTESVQTVNGRLSEPHQPSTSSGFSGGPLHASGVANTAQQTSINCSGSPSICTPNRCSSNRSSSSLSTSDTYYSSLFIVCQENHQQPSNVGSCAASSSSSGAYRVPSSAGSGSVCSVSGRGSRSSSIAGQASCLQGGGGGCGCVTSLRTALVHTRKDSRSTLSRASTSGGSYEDEEGEDSDIDLGERANTHTHTEPSVGKPRTGPHRQMQHQQQLLKPRYQLVKAVQSSITNFTRSTTNSPALGAKRFICTALTKSMGSTNTKRIEATILQAPQVAYSVPILQQRHLANPL